ncbi:hypothetical protein K503DRAFT_681122 [Rhizopogon vinicolor AM-OR11-026]|uniref:Coupling of ubiquitin conjugation to ER degradation protein 1 n=1 Tax=Rhizopogon vinicolor AM-OR11-026 TaxID=1314800 RepID=A0A1B7NF38_9AGAM|nr:hypothetical protein K503DRAFT_681122 [Rhizopogon vinicolor AM-OR11-026]
MSEVVNAIVAFAVIVVIFRWATSSLTPANDSSSGRSTSAALGFRPKNVTQEMVDQIHTMFPNIPQENIRYDLLRTGSVEITSNKILERGYLDVPPPAYFTLYPRTAATPQARQAAAQAQTTGLPQNPKDNLISRYKLQDRVATSTFSMQDDDASSKANWENTSEKREASLQERKTKMILAARQRLLAQQAQKEGAGASS